MPCRRYTLTGYQLGFSYSALRHSVFVHEKKMKMRTSYRLLLALTLSLPLVSCGDNSYDKHSETSDTYQGDSISGFQTGPESETVADPNAANTKKTAVPLEPVVVDTSATAENR
jgi:hypothetical protein